jgi:hypothetical protein
MNDFERLLRSQPFREVPPEWRREIVHRAREPDGTRAAGWREWLWPSPLAWGAMAAVWLVFLGGELSVLTHPRDTTADLTGAAPAVPEEPAVPRAFMFAPGQELLIANLR